MNQFTDAPTEFLFGLLAVQNDLIAPEAARAALRAVDRGVSVGEQLVAAGALTESQRQLLDSLSCEYISKHGGDARLGLASLLAAVTARERLDSLGDGDLTETLESLGTTVAPHDGADLGFVTVPNWDGGRFRVLRPHAKGGIGEVFVALDAELNREVALKRIQDRHADEPGSRARFLREAEITGGLEHPGIVPVYALGRDDAGRPYYAMRFIRGRSLKKEVERFRRGEQGSAAPTDDDRSDAPAPAPVASGPGATEGTIDPGRRSLEFRKLLRRFIDVCHAIDYAHARGVLHRDIKPGNIIVGKHGETLVVDWGLAKAKGESEPDSHPGERRSAPSAGDSQAETLPGSVMGTPSYMSPEQACGDVGRLGPASDIYSLGATLFCLLTGDSPFQGATVEVLRAVQQGKFPAPRTIDPKIDRALEAVCLKAMSLEPADRYGSCRALAEDLERWAADEPVSAWREPLARRARCWARRNRTAVAAAVVAMVAGLIGLAAVAGVQAHANTALLRANDEKARRWLKPSARRPRHKRRSSNRRRRASRPRRSAGFSSRHSAAPTRASAAARSRSPTSSTGPAPRLEKDFAGSRSTRVALLDALGKTYWGLGLFDQAAKMHSKARSLSEAALGRDHPSTLKFSANLAIAYRSAGRLPEAIALDEETLKLRRAVLGSDHADTIQSRNGLAAAYWTVGRTSEAITLHEENLKLKEAKYGPSHPETLKTRNNLAVAYWNAGRTAESVELNESTLKLKEAALGRDHPDTLNSRNNLALVYRMTGRLDDAIELDETTLALREAKLGPDHRDTLASRENLAIGYMAPAG